jgi:ribonucleoside-triphosphate reductase
MVIKRDGKRVPFDGLKIKAAIEKAYKSLDVDPGNVGTHIASAAFDYFGFGVESTEATVEDIQDFVERSLMTAHPDVAKAYILFRQERTKSRQLRPIDGELGRYIHPAKYARYIPELKRRELFHETVKRVFNMHGRADLSETQLMVLQQRILPSMRTMQFAGPAIEKNHARLYNCSFTHIDRLSFFGEAFWLLLSGCGVGFSVQKEHVAFLPEVKKQMRQVVHHTVEDSIEGWATAIHALVHNTVAGRWVEMNYQLVRGEGSPLVTTGGKAPGHIPLRNAIEKIRTLILGAQGRRLRPIECYDMTCFLAEAVLAGGVRRSSLICLFSYEDDEMMYAKSSPNFDWHSINTQRKMSNNSPVLLRHTVTEEQISKIVKAAMENWDPGLYLTNDKRYGTNPCGEIGMDPVLILEDEYWLEEIQDEHYRQVCWERGYIVGWSFCNLTEINGAVCKTAEEFYEACKHAAILGTVQATYTDFPFLGRTTERICRRDALLGVSITGMADNPDICFNPDILVEGNRIVHNTNIEWAAKLGINPAARLTCIKPSGTASLELGGVASGVHDHHAKRYIRRVKANPHEPVYQFFRSVNPHAVEEISPTEHVVLFPIYTEGRVMDDTSDIQFLERVKLVYKNWIRDYSDLTHNVSCSVPVQDVDAVIDWIRRNVNDITALSFIAPFNEKGIPHLPRQKVDDPATEALWRDLIEKWTPVDYSKMVEENGVNEFDVECAGGACKIG